MPIDPKRASFILGTLVAASFALPGPALSQPAPAQACAEIQVQNVRPGQGHLMIAAYASADTFGKQPMAVLRLAAGAARMQVQLCGLSGDVVALMLFQDLDSDGKMGRNLMGVPIEPWGSSGKPGAFGPSWETGKVVLNGQAIVVELVQ